ncbi:MAG TPA: hypothetical protein VGU25_09170 [Acidobacteriaceae bacterium]|nr:hypothetical protein [Acidobacteriaceae bacterium]
MHAEWSAECSAEAAVLVVPWSDADGGAHFVNLRTEPYSIAEIPEAERFPDLARALRALNANRSPFLTAKCDAWPLSVRDSADDLELMRKELLIEADEATYAFTSYIDLLWRERTVFASAHQQQDRIDRIVRRAGKLQHTESMLQCVLRPAIVDLGAPLEGFATTLYVTSLAPDAELANRRWASALEDVVDLLRSREFEINRLSVTIDL